LKKLNIAFRNPEIAAAERLVERYTAAVHQFDFSTPPSSGGQRSYQVPGLSWSLLL
jgi:hypothetical protein